MKSDNQEQLTEKDDRYKIKMDALMIQKLNEVMNRYEELSASVSQPEIAQNYAVCQQFLKEMNSLEALVQSYRAYQQTEKHFEEAKELLSDPDMVQEAETEIKELAEKKQKLEDELKLLLVPPDPRDHKNVILELRAGAGGEEAALFAADLMRMYLKYADRNQLHASILSLNDSDLGGVNEALLMISGKEAYAKFKFESGVHCVKRVPVTESGGRIHTSTVTVAVLPEAEDPELKLDPADLRIDVFHATGHGGQGVNTTDSAVRITHIPTGMVVTCQDERSQLENKNKAIRVLRSRLLKQIRIQQESEYAANRKDQIGSGDRSERIRTYYFNHDYVVDHRIGLMVPRTGNVMNGELSPFTDALRLAEKTSKLEHGVRKES